MYKKPLLLIVFICSLCTATYAQKGNKFPELEVEPIKGETMVLPQGVSGKITLIGIAYSAKSDRELKTWFNPMYREYIAPVSEDLFVPAIQYDLELYFVAMLKGINQAAGGTLEHKFDEELEEDLKPHVSIHKGAIKAYKKSLKLGKKDHPYFFLIDEKGIILYTTYGPFSTKKLDEITAIVEKHQ